MAKKKEEQQETTTETTAPVGSDESRQMLLEGQEFDAPTETESPQEPEQAAADDPVEGEPQVPVEDAEQPAAPTGVEVGDQAPALQDQLQRLGFRDIPEDQNEILDRVIRAYEDQQTQFKQYEQLAQYGHKYLQEQMGREETPTTAEEQVERDAQQQQEEAWWSPPKFEQAWLERYREVKIDPRTNEPMVDWKDNTPTDVKKAFAERQQYMEEWADALVTRPDEVLPQIIRQEVGRMLNEEFTQRDEAARHDAVASQIERDNADWMYEADPRTGDRRYSQDGELMVSILEDVTQRFPGINDPAERWELAVQRFDNIKFAEQMKQQTAAPTSEPSGNGNSAPDKRKEHLKKGANQGLQNRRGSVAPAETPSDEPQNPHLSRGEALLQQLRQDGHEV